MTKDANFGPNLVVFGQKILIFTGEIKSSGTHISKTTNAPRLHCFIGRALHQMDQKGQYLAQNDNKCIFFGQIWPILGQKS